MFICFTLRVCVCVHVYGHIYLHIYTHKHIYHYLSIASTKKFLKYCINYVWVPESKHRSWGETHHIIYHQEVSSMQQTLLGTCTEPGMMLQGYQHGWPMCLSSSYILFHPHKSDSSQLLVEQDHCNGWQRSCGHFWASSLPAPVPRPSSWTLSPLVPALLFFSSLFPI